MGICDVAVPEWEALKTAGEDPRRCVRKELGHVIGQRVEDIPTGRIGTRYVHWSLNKQYISIQNKICVMHPRTRVQ